MFYNPCTELVWLVTVYAAVKHQTPAQMDIMKTRQKQHVTSLIDASSSVIYKKKKAYLQYGLGEYIFL